MRKLWPLALMIAGMIALLFTPLMLGDTQLFLEFFAPFVFVIVLSCVGFWALLRDLKESNKPGA